MATPSQIPGAGSWLGQQRAYLSAWQQAQAQAKAAQGNLSAQYGFDASGNPDPLNTGGSFWQQGNAQGQQMLQANSNIASRGFNANSGFGSQLIQPLRQAQSVQDSRMLQAYDASEGKINAADSQAYSRYQTGMYGALQNAINLARKNRSFNTPGAPTGGVNVHGQNMDSKQAVIRFLKQNKLGTYSAWARSHPQDADYFIR